MNLILHDGHLSNYRCAWRSESEPCAQVWSSPDVVEKMEATDVVVPGRGALEVVLHWSFAKDAMITACAKPHPEIPADPVHLDALLHGRHCASVQTVHHVQLNSAHTNPQGLFCSALLITLKGRARYFLIEARVTPSLQAVPFTLSKSWSWSSVTPKSSKPGSVGRSPLLRRRSGWPRYLHGEGRICLEVSGMCSVGLPTARSRQVKRRVVICYLSTGKLKSAKGSETSKFKSIQHRGRRENFSLSLQVRCDRPSSKATLAACNCRCWGRTKMYCKPGALSRALRVECQKSPSTFATVSEVQPPLLS